MICNFIVLRNGLPITNVSLDPKYRLTDDNNKFTLVSGFFQAINSFADSVENLGQIDEVQMTDLLFTFQRKSLKGKDKEVLFILTTEGTTNKTLRKIIIEEASSTFLYMFSKNLEKEWNGDIKPYRKFEDVFLEIVEKLLENHDEDEFSLKSSSTKGKEKYQMPEIVTTIPLKSYSQSLESFNSTPSNKTHPQGSISKRFENYQALQIAQNNLKSFNNSNTRALTAQSFQSQPLYTNFQQLQRFAEDTQIPQQQGMSTNQFSKNHLPSYSRDSLNSERMIPSGFNPMTRNNPFNSSDNSFPEDYGYPQGNNSDFYRPPVHHLIPVKNPITAGVFRNRIQNSWMKVLMVAIDGRKTLQSLAQILDMPLSDVIQACEHLEKQEFITFR